MLGDHEGITPLDDPSVVSGPVLRALARLKAGGDVPKRQKIIARAVAQIEASDRHWMETLASKLASDDGLDAIPAHAAALAAAFELREIEVARLIREVNTQGSDQFSAKAVRGMMAATPEFAERLKANKINSDEVMIRVALAHAFRRDPSSTFSMFIVDGIARSIPKSMKMGVTDFVKSCLERFDDSPAPDDAWGYVLVLREMNARSGYFITHPGADALAETAHLRTKLEGMMGPLSDDAFSNHVAAAAYSAHLNKGNVAGFAGLMSGIMHLTNERFLILYAREDEGEGGGVHTHLIPIPAESAEQARRIVVKMPEVLMHDDFKVMTEFMAQQKDMEATRKD